MSWQPIETAPRNGTTILLRTAYGVIEGFWSYGRWEQNIICSTYDMAGTYFDCEPTHWMSLDVLPALDNV